MMMMSFLQMSHAVGIKWHKLAVPTQQLTPIFNNSRGAFAAKFWAGVAGESGPVTWHDVTLESAPQNPELVGAHTPFVLPAAGDGRMPPMTFAGTGSADPHRFLRVAWREQIFYLNVLPDPTRSEGICTSVQT